MRDRNGKFVSVTGGMLSSVGKGIVTSSIGKMLQTQGFRVTAIKIDHYVNVDAGTMNPYIHGEVAKASQALNIMALLEHALTENKPSQRQNSNLRSQKSLRCEENKTR